MNRNSRPREDGDQTPHIGQAPAMPQRTREVNLSGTMGAIMLAAVALGPKTAEAEGIAAALNDQTVDVSDLDGNDNNFSGLPSGAVTYKGVDGGEGNALFVVDSTSSGDDGIYEVSDVGDPSSAAVTQVVAIDYPLMMGENTEAGTLAVCSGSSQECHIYDKESLTEVANLTYMTGGSDAGVTIAEDYADSTQGYAVIGKSDGNLSIVDTDTDTEELEIQFDSNDSSSYPDASTISQSRDIVAKATKDQLHIVYVDTSNLSNSTSTEVTLEDSSGNAVKYTRGLVNIDDGSNAYFILAVNPESSTEAGYGSALLAYDEDGNLVGEWTDSSSSMSDWDALTIKDNNTIYLNQGSSGTTELSVSISGGSVTFTDTGNNYAQSYGTDTIVYVADVPTDTYYLDSDGDGYGDPSSTTEATSKPSGYVDNAEDCDDSDSSINPGATEVCDGDDNDCDGLTDDADSDVTGQSTWYPDNDGDGYGADGTTTDACEEPTGYADNNEDCDDSDASVNPGAGETPYNQKNDDCQDSTPDDDVDADGFGQEEDCDDYDSAKNPDEIEDCTDGEDNNCDGLVDQEDPSCQTGSEDPACTTDDLGNGATLGAGETECEEICLDDEDEDCKLSIAFNSGDYIEAADGATWIEHTGSDGSGYETIGNVFIDGGAFDFSALKDDSLSEPSKQGFTVTGPGMTIGTYSSEVDLAGDELESGAYEIDVYVESTQDGIPVLTKAFGEDVTTFTTSSMHELPTLQTGDELGITVAPDGTVFVDTDRTDSQAIDDACADAGADVCMTGDEIEAFIAGEQDENPDDTGTTTETPGNTPGGNTENPENPGGCSTVQANTSSKLGALLATAGVFLTAVARRRRED